TGCAPRTEDILSGPAPQIRTPGPAAGRPPARSPGSPVPPSVSAPLFASRTPVSADRPASVTNDSQRSFPPFTRRCAALAADGCCAPGHPPLGGFSRVTRPRTRSGARRQCLPAHRDLPLPPPHRAVRDRPVGGEGVDRTDPALAGAVGGVGRGGGPGAVEVAQEGVHRLTRDIAVDERLRQAFRQVGGAVEGGEPGREGDRARPLGAEGHPYVPASDLVAGPLDEQSAAGARRRVGGRETRAQALPDA